jgi:hypothetical protein
MALKGNLRDFSITQLLNLINLANKTGRLVVERPTETISLYFQDGKLVYARDEIAKNNLVTVLYQAGKLNVRQQQFIRERSRDMSDKEIGLLLIQANYLSRQEILLCLQTHFILILNRLFNWPDGAFSFENDQVPPDGKIKVKLSLENLIIEGTRRMREQEQLQDEIPSLDMALKFAERPGANIRQLNLSVDEWRVISFINPKNSMRQIASATKLSDMELRRIIFGFLQAGLVEIIKPVDPLNPDGGHSQLPVSKLAGSVVDQKSLINRIINRIRSL